MNAKQVDSTEMYPKKVKFYLVSRQLLVVKGLLHGSSKRGFANKMNEKPREIFHVRNC
jgi:hypothetical protein